MFSRERDMGKEIEEARETQPGTNVVSPLRLLTRNPNCREVTSARVEKRPRI